MNRPLSGRTYSVILAAALAVTFACLAYPIYVIRPFRAQGPRELLAGLSVVRIRPVLTVIVTLVAVAALIAYWRTRPRWWRRAGAIFGTLAVAGFTLLSRVNVYELMFHPLGRPGFTAAAQSKLDGGEMVIALKSRAYPIRILSYHHIANDTVGGVPVVATY